MKKIVAFISTLIFFATVYSQSADNAWQLLQPFIGTWTGEGVGEPGKGVYERTYQYVMDKKFIECKNKSVYQPTDKNPKGEIHQDIGYFSYDKDLRKLKLRQFHIEGFVNEFVLDSVSRDGKTIVFLSVAIENIPKGFRARETYKMLSESEITEIFEIAEPDKNFQVYSTVNLKKK